MSRYLQLQAELRSSPRKWVVTGAAGFIGSHLVETLLGLGQTVVGLDNLATGHRRNLDDVRRRLSAAQWDRFEFVEGDIVRMQDHRRSLEGAHHLLHQAALGSVPRSVANPLVSHVANVDGFIQTLVAARDAGVQRLVYASSSSVYGDHPALPKVETAIGRPLSPYAATKLIDEIYADVFARTYGMRVVGLRYFNVFGPRQDPNGVYAAVIPRWFSSMLRGEAIQINGDGATSRDFSYVANVVQANLLAACAPGIDSGTHRVYNVACGERTTLLQLYKGIKDLLKTQNPSLAVKEPAMKPERAGDVRHSLANIDAARTELGYEPTHGLDAGLAESLSWYTQAEAQPIGK